VAGPLRRGEAACLHDHHEGPASGRCESGNLRGTKPAHLQLGKPVEDQDPTNASFHNPDMLYSPLLCNSKQSFNEAYELNGIDKENSPSETLMHVSKLLYLTPEKVIPYSNKTLYGEIVTQNSLIILQSIQ
jgi:hypothetical protein